jgi:hypothetical protein
MKWLLLSSLLGLSIFSCSPQKTEKVTQGTEPKPAAAAFATLPLETLRTLVAECDYIDLIVYNPSFSMSQSEPASIQATLQQIGEAAPVHQANNQAFGRIFYQAKGETLLEADVFLSQAGSYFIFYQDKKQAFANIMTPQGVNFYINILNRLQGSAPQ